MFDREYWNVKNVEAQAIDLKQTRYDESPLRIYVGSLAAYNAGTYCGLWINLPCDNDALDQVMDIYTHSGDWDFEIFDREGDLRELADAYSSPHALNDLCKRVKDWDAAQMAAANALKEYNGTLTFDEIVEKVENSDGIEIHNGTLQDWGEELLERRVEGFNGVRFIGPFAVQQRRDYNSFIALLQSCIDTDKWIRENTWDTHIVEGIVDDKPITILIHMR